MKKFFTLMIVALIAAMPVMANRRLNATDITAERKVLTPEVEAKLHEGYGAAVAALNSDGDVTSKRVVRRSYTQGTDTYNFVMVNLDMYLTDFWRLSNSSKDSLSFEDIPLYIVQVMLNRTDINGNVTGTVGGLCAYPSYMMWADDDPSLEMVDFVEFCNSKKISDHYCSKFVYGNDQYVTCNLIDEGRVVDCYFMWTQTGNNTYLTESIDGKSGKLADSIVVSNSDMTLLPTASIVDINGYDEEERTINVPMRWFVNVNNNVNSLACDYDGEFRQLGFIIEDLTYDIGSTHLFNVGEYSEKIAGHSNPFDVPFEPVNVYYVIAVDKTLEIGLAADATSFSEAKIETYRASEDVTPSISAIRGYLIAPLNYDIEKGGEFKMQDWTDMFYDEYYGEYLPNVTMRPYSLIPGRVIENNNNFYKWSERFGFVLIWDGYYVQCPSGERAKKSMFGLTTTEGYVYFGYSQYGDVYRMKYDGDVVYHDNPKNMNDVVTIKSVGEFVSGVDAVEGESSSIVAENGNVIVKATADVEVNIYGMNGVRVAGRSVNGGENTTFALGKGIYVVKAGADVKKVVL